jgi:hypothetical protein
VVKKSSFLEKLKNRLRHSDVQVETPERGAPATPPKARATEPGARTVGADDPVLARGSARPVGPERPVGAERARIEPMPTSRSEEGAKAAEPAAPPKPEALPVLEPFRVSREPEAVAGRKMSQREEATVAIQDGFRELTNLLRGMQHRVEDQGERFAQAADGLSRMPAIQEAQLELLRQLADRMEVQDRTHALVAQSLGDLPQLMGSVREALDRAAATDDRTARTLGEFRSNMERIQGSMEQMVDHSRQQVDHSRQHAEHARQQAEHVRQQAEATAALVADRGSEVAELAETLVGGQKEATRDAVSRLEATQRDSVRSLRDAQADQALRLGKMLEDGTKTSRAVLVLLGLTFLALVTIAVLLANG